MAICGAEEIQHAAPHGGPAIFESWQLHILKSLTKGKRRLETNARSCPPAAVTAGAGRTSWNGLHGHAIAGGLYEVRTSIPRRPERSVSQFDSHASICSC